MRRASRTTVAGAAARAALVPAAAVAVHQLRYLLAFRGAAGAALQATGHAYLHSVVPWVVGMLGLAAGGFLWALGRALGGRGPGARREAGSLVALWLLCTATLVAIYAGQELLEGFVLAGHPLGLGGIFGHGGVWALPAAACVGLILAAVFHVAGRVLGTLAARPGATGARPAPAGRPLRPVAVVAPRPAPLAGGWSGRGPPVG